MERIDFDYNGQPIEEWAKEMLEEMIKDSD